MTPNHRDLGSLEARRAKAAGGITAEAIGLHRHAHGVLVHATVAIEILHRADAQRGALGQVIQGHGDAARGGLGANALDGCAAQPDFGAVKDRDQELALAGFDALDGQFQAGGLGRQSAGAQSCSKDQGAGERVLEHIEFHRLRLRWRACSRRPAARASRLRPTGAAQRERRQGGVTGGSAPAWLHLV